MLRSLARSRYQLRWAFRVVTRVSTVRRWASRVWSRAGPVEPDFVQRADLVEQRLHPGATLQRYAMHVLGRIDIGHRNEADGVEVRGDEGR